MRSIPARAGEPTTPFVSAIKSRVYPRACGGTGAGDTYQLAGYGLSPRVRGNPATRQENPSPEGSIPARAGEPRMQESRNIQCRVYPRACGGTRFGCCTV